MAVAACHPVIWHNTPCCYVTHFDSGTDPIGFSPTSCQRQSDHSRCFFFYRLFCLEPGTPSEINERCDTQLNILLRLVGSTDGLGWISYFSSIIVEASHSLRISCSRLQWWFRRCCNSLTRAISPSFRNKRGICLYYWWSRNIMHSTVQQEPTLTGVCTDHT